MRVLIVAAAVALLGAACSGDDADREGAGDRATAVSVVASFYPLAEAAEAVGGDLVSVDNLTPAGSEPHDLELTTRQVDRLEDADVVLYLGEGFQPAVEQVAERRDGPSLDLLDALAVHGGGGDDEDHGHDHDGADPHFWLDPTLQADAAEQVRAALTDAAPEHAAAFQANTERYQDQLAALDGEFEAALANCERHVIVTSHSAFHYLAERYDLDEVSIAGLSPESEPSPDRLAELTDLIQDEGITTVLYETLVAPDVAETLAREAGVDTAVLNPLEGLSEDDLDAGKDYAAVMRDNLAVLTEALDCS